MKQKACAMLAVLRKNDVVSDVVHWTKLDVCREERGDECHVEGERQGERRGDGE